MKAILTLHRKVGSQRECICGARLKHISGNWVCPDQYKKEEPSSIDLARDSRYSIKKADNIILSYMPKIRTTVKPRKRGRPKGGKNKKPKIIQKRGRGRPKGSKNKPK